VHVVDAYVLRLSTGHCCFCLQGWFTIKQNSYMISIDNMSAGHVVSYELGQRLAA
jgi:hypothetical protein